MANNLAGSFAAIQQTVDLLQQSNLIAQQSAIYQSQMALSMTLMEAEGIEAQLQLNEIATAANIQSDLSLMATRNILLLSSKAYETAILMAQFREKTLNMFLTIIDQRSNNVWQRIKGLTQGFKF